MERILGTDVHSLITPRLAAVIPVLVAGGAGNNAAVTGLVIDRFAFGSLPLCADLVLGFDASLAAGDTLSLKAVSLQTSTDGVNFSAYASFADPGVVATGPAGGGAVQGQVRFGVNLSSANRYLRLAFTPVLSAAANDTARLAALLILAGFDTWPAPL